MDTKGATLSNLVEDVLKGQLGYGEEFSVKRDADLLYDVDEEIHLEKTFEDLGLKADTFITVFDEAETDAKVDVILSVIEKEATDGAAPLSLSGEVVIPKKPAKPASQRNGHANGKIDATMHSSTNGSTKRKASEAGLKEDIIAKRGKVMEHVNGNGYEKIKSSTGTGASKEDVLVIEDDGAIVID